MESMKDLKKKISASFNNYNVVTAVPETGVLSLVRKSLNVEEKKLSDHSIIHVEGHKISTVASYETMGLRSEKETVDAVVRAIKKETNYADLTKKIKRNIYLDLIMSSTMTEPAKFKWSFEARKLDYLKGKEKTEAETKLKRLIASAYGVSFEEVKKTA